MNRRDRKVMVASGMDSLLARMMLDLRRQYGGSVGDQLFQYINDVLGVLEDEGEENRAIQNRLSEVIIMKVKEILEDPDFQERLRAAIKERIVQQIRSQDFVKEVRDLMQKTINDIAVDVVAENMVEAETRIKEILAKEWEVRVAKTAHEILDSKLGEVRRAMGGGK